MGFIEFDTKLTVGRFAIGVGRWKFHFLPRNKEDRFWGLRNDWYDGPHWLFGLGPFLLISIW